VRVLSLDGGGVKGALQARLLERLEAQAPFLSRVDLFTGTSIGGIQALALAAGVPLAKLVALFRDKARLIFGPRDLADTLSGGLDEYVRANFGQDPLREALVELFGDMRLSQLKREVMVTTFDLARFRPVFLDRSDDWSCVDAGLATSAAPTYLPVHLVRSAKAGLAACVDGGVFANNPSERALTFARELGAKEVTMLSVGAGKPPTLPPEEALEEGKRMLDWGFRQWVVKRPHLLLKLWFDGAESLAHYSCHKQLHGDYCRVQPVLGEDVDLADHAKVPMLFALADAFDTEEALAWLKLYWRGA
jgi:hypothetical protein